MCIRVGSVAATAHELGISETTVHRHLGGLYRRTGCVNAAQTAHWRGAMELELVVERSHRSRRVGTATIRGG